MNSRNVDVEHSTFFKIKKQQFVVSEKSMTVIQIQEVTDSIRLERSTGEAKSLQIVNACVSHEMRNPLNSIISQNHQIK